MKTIKRWIENIKWVFNHPPTSIVSEVPKGTKCEFCGAEDDLHYYDTPSFCICFNCIAKAYRKILTKE